MKNKEIKLNVSEKHLPLRIVGFVLAVVVAVTAMAAGIMSLTEKPEGWYEVAQQDDETAMLYRAGVSFQYHYTGSSSAVRAAMRELEPFFSERLRENYRLLDAETEWVPYQNIATLNAHMGEEIQVSPALYAVLLDAYERTRRQEGYNLFAGPLYAEWNSILYSASAADYDPDANPAEAERLHRLAALAGDLTQYRLEVVDEATCTLRLEVSEKVREELAALECEAGVLDLNLLHDAYLLQMLSGELEEAGWTKGVLSTQSGLAVNLSESDAGEFFLHDQRDGTVKETGALPGGPGTAMSRFRLFPVNDEAGYYAHGAVWRGPFVTASGVFSDVIRASYLPGGEENLVDTVYHNIRLHALTTRKAVEEALPEGAVVYFYD